MAFQSLSILIFLQVGRPQDFFPFLTQFRLAVLFTLITLLLTFFFKSGDSTKKLFISKESKLYLFLFAIMIFGIPFAFHRAMAFECVFLKYLSNILLFFLILTHVESEKKLRTLLLVICVSVTFISCMSLVQGSMKFGRFYYRETGMDPNDLAYFFVSFLPFFFIFTRKNCSLIIKLLAITGLTTSVLIIVLSGSRGGMIGFSIFVFYFLFTKVIIRGMMIKGTIVALILLVLAQNYDKINVERISSLTNVTSDYNITSEQGRLGIWKTAVGITARNPISGVGVCCFNKAIGQERSNEGKVGRWQSPHNSFVQIFTELGMIGFMVFLSLIFTSLKNFRAFSKCDPATGECSEFIKDTGALLRIGFLCSLVCAFFLSQAYSVIFTLYLAISAIMRTLKTQIEHGEGTS